MSKSFLFILICSLCFFVTAKTVNARRGMTNSGNIKKDNNDRLHLPLPGNCPSDETLKNNTDWVEHTEDWNKYLDNILETHFSLPLSPEKPTLSLNLTPVNVNRGMGVSKWREIIWTVNRTNQKDYVGQNYNCYVIGMAAYYVEAKNKNGWPPDALFLEIPESEEKWLKEGAISLIELRWYDAVEKKRHRWFNRRLASFLDWLENNYFSPIPLPLAINTLN